MTALTMAERKARSRTMRWGGIAGHLDVAQEALALLEHELTRISPEAQNAIRTLEAHIAQARALVPKNGNV